VIVYDRLEANEDSTFEYWLHAINKISAKDQHNIRVQNGDVVCDVDFLAPTGLSFAQTDQYDPNPRARITLREWNLTGTTGGKRKRVEFVTLYRPRRIKDAAPKAARLERIDGGYVLEATVGAGTVTALLATNDGATLKADGLQSKGAIKCRVQGANGRAVVVGLDE